MMNALTLFAAGEQTLGSDVYIPADEVASLDDGLNSILYKLEELMGSIWPWIIGIMIAAVVIWGAYIGIRIAIAHRNEDQVNARAMVKNLVIGVIVMFVIAVGAPLLIEGLVAWVG